MTYFPYGENNNRIDLPMIGVLSSPWADGTGNTVGASRSSRNEMLSSDGSVSQWVYAWPVSMITGSFRAECVATSEFRHESCGDGPGKNTIVWL